MELLDISYVKNCQMGSHHYSEGETKDEFDQLECSDTKYMLGAMLDVEDTEMRAEFLPSKCLESSRRRNIKRQIIAFLGDLFHDIQIYNIYVFIYFNLLFSNISSYDYIYIYNFSQ
jgi:hypothetical protein